ncbi:Zn-ribbon domain-containing OB-fold protein [Gryllotalpicola protaetiae]|uniref:Zn-ribbon domain-containing OB-fold protein n=1 Tax=Gryllotalpicola protaetiae TaxID=2419771 RepID=A0A387BLB1_9MICO|nr:Zn-ribbon domain-containing OB-fold protein [Gryllotalpicola protaetiae]AYG03142.1 Zn-ribbon domain-containing OB-fold protein [Gryllotalpicola protaetiae]
MSGQLPAPTPDISPEAAPFWEGTARGELRLQRCGQCGTVVWYPRGLCPSCSSSGLEWFTATGSGRIYSFSVNRRGDGAFREASPFVLAYVELDEGPRVLTNIVGVDPDAVEIDLPVRAVFADTGAGTALLRFRPA